MFYPLSGFIADVCCGRLKTVVISLVFLLSCWILSLLGVALLETIPSANYLSMRHNQGILVVILTILSLLSFIIGLAGYQANFIQLGLDQLFEALSQYLGVFVHYATWAFCLGSLINFFMVLCYNNLVKIALLVMQILILLVFITLLLSATGSGDGSLVNLDIKILTELFMNSLSLPKAASTHSDAVPSLAVTTTFHLGWILPRRDLEDLSLQSRLKMSRQFFRILLVLFAVGPVFALGVSASYFIASLFGMHFNHYSTHKKELLQR